MTKMVSKDDRKANSSSVLVMLSWLAEGETVLLYCAAEEDDAPAGSAVGV